VYDSISVFSLSHDKNTLRVIGCGLGFLTGIEKREDRYGVSSTCRCGKRSSVYDSISAFSLSPAAGASVSKRQQFGYDSG